MAQLICRSCGADFVFRSRTVDWEIDYCPTCGVDHKTKRDVPRDQWLDKRDQMLKKQAANVRKLR